jgi:3D (Asp-Asp-Asp) domain-containing protein
MLASGVTAQKRPNGQTKVGRMGPISPLTAEPQQTVLNITVSPKVRVLVDAWVEYNPTTCTEISPGSWDVTTEPQYGKTTKGTVVGTLGNGDCPGDTFTFAAIYYTWTSTDPNVTTDYFAATWTSPDYQVTDEVNVALSTVSLSRQSLMQVEATGTPDGGSFSYSAQSVTGSSLAGIDIATGVTATTNPNTATLSDPPNPTPKQTPSPGGLAKITADYKTSSTATDSFKVPTFGMSCYYTTLESDWGTVPNKCLRVRIKGVVYSGTVTNPYGLTGTYCSSFIAEVVLQGSGVLTGGQDVQYISGVIEDVSVINGADGTPVIANETVARDRSIIPTGGVLVDIDQVGNNLLANDTGGDILGYRIDLYKGAGKAVCLDYDNIISVSACNPGNSKCPASAIQ